MACDISKVEERKLLLLSEYKITVGHSLHCMANWLSFWLATFTAHVLNLNSYFVLTLVSGTFSMLEWQHEINTLQ